ncbi:DNA polymerase III subunit gamma and tau [Agromyces marinus]|uniref:DNA polymerase III subunit gamma and tau n=1 Tax=Agromyces marinus TaxID=1389020 RepID=UPI0038994E00
MIGQSQVTEPLMTALRTDRVNHAYLFSGPRGCGKTTSARILARCLNCAEGPTDTPCGVCPSCVELSRKGGGSLDVVEIDAASHNGVDDARDLRERAVFAPARDRYKIFILDEAHMVTPQGFNALLKLVEEPPEHVKFIFATTEPDKVLGTIRSRTHHYPFRLVPPAPMLEYVQGLCDEEAVSVEPGVLALVVRAGGGSPRDTLSLLDQLIAGSEGSTVGYERAVALLGYTHGTLLDEVVDAVGAADAARAFAAVDRVMQTGQDPRRFVEDLLERLRDLIVVAATSAQAAAAVLRGVPGEELERMSAQAAAFGPAELSRVADLVNQTLTDMTGATSPRLHLELMLARVLVPAADDTERGAVARVERLERRVEAGIAAPRAATRTASAAPAAAAPAAPAASAPAAPPAPAPERAPAPAAAAGPAVVAAPTEPGPTEPGPTEPGPTEPDPTRPAGPVTAGRMREAWPDVLTALQRTKRSAWMVALSAQILEYRDDDVLVLGFPSESDMSGFRSGPPGQTVGDLLRAAIEEVLGVRVKFLGRVGGNPGGGGGARANPPAPTTSGPASPGTGRPAAQTAAQSPAQAAGDPASERGASGTQASAPTAAQASPAPSAPSGPVDSWATVAIPTPDADAGATGVAEASASTSTRTALAERPAAKPAPDLDDVPPLDDADAPPPEDEPDFAPEPPAAPPAPAAAPAPTAPPAPERRGSAPGIQRYGEAVVRDLLGATFLEEVEAPATRFGERG